MKPSFVTLLLSAYLSVQPGYQYHFPADHFSHPGYQSEWWYYTGNLRDSAGHRYGFELTFFRQAMEAPPSAASSVWRPDQIYLAHLALTDIDARTFYHTERLNRTGPGLAGADLNARKYWNGNWQVRWKNLSTSEQELEAVCERFTLTLDLNPLKPPVIQGKDSVIRKGPADGETSHYISFSRLSAQGHLNGAPVSGLAWMDHEFFTEQASPTYTGWDWFAIQLDNNEELMLYRMRDQSGSVNAYSSGAYVDSTGASHPLSADQIDFTPGRLWHGYPVEWRIDIPSLDLRLSERPRLDDQELTSHGSLSPTYWEGAVTYSGAIHGKVVEGMGYLELTGYAQPFRLPH